MPSPIERLLAARDNLEALPEDKAALEQWRALPPESRQRLIEAWRQPAGPDMPQVGPESALPSTQAPEPPSPTGASPAAAVAQAAQVPVSQAQTPGFPTIEQESLEKPSMFLDPIEAFIGLLTGATLGKMAGKGGMALAKEALRSGVGFQTGGLSEIPALIKGVGTVVKAAKAGYRGITPKIPPADPAVAAKVQDFTAAKEAATVGEPATQQAAEQAYPGLTAHIAKEATPLAQATQLELDGLGAATKLPDSISSLGSPSEIKTALDARSGPLYEKISGWAATKAGNLLQATTMPSFKAAGAAAKIADEMGAVFSPVMRGEASKKVTGMLREGGARLELQRLQGRAALAKASTMFDAMELPASREFMYAMDEGRPQANVALQPIADQLTGMFKDRRAQIEQLGPGALSHFIEDYFPRLFKDPEKAAAAARIVTGTGSLEGVKGFTRKRGDFTLRQAIEDHGLQLIDDNPITVALAKAYEQDRYIMGQRVFREMKQKGLAQFVKFGGDAPENWVPINDKIARVLQYSPDEGGYVIRGAYYTPKDAGRIIDNYLSPGLGRYKTYELYRKVNNNLNFAQLGLSAFHAGVTSFNSAISDVALGIQQLSAGRPIQALKSMIRAPAQLLFSAPDIWTGSKVLKAAMAPGSQGAEMAQIVDRFIKGGGRVSMDRFYSNNAIEQFMKAWNAGSPMGMARNTWGATMEAISKPVMGYMVPRAKLGTFARLAEFEMSRLPTGASDDLVRATLGKAWDSIDNRFGQLVYDNLFWSKHLKDIGLASVRALGWNLGTFRELGGGILFDLPKELAHLATGKGFQMSSRMAYSLGLVSTVGTVGAIYNYLATGEAPRDLKDLYYPRTGLTRKDGNPDRVSLPTYMKDVYSYYRDPVATVSHKLAPALQATIEMLQNRDYFGGEIRNPDAPAVQQFGEVMKFVASQYVPFSVQNIRKEMESGASGLSATQAAVGITPAPGHIVQTPEQARTYEMRQRAPAIRRRMRREAQPSLLDQLIRGR